MTLPITPAQTRAYERERLAKLAENIINPLRPETGRQVAAWLRNQGTDS